MDEIQYLGEYLFPGNIGRTFVLTAFFGALLSAIAYVVSAQSKGDSAASWKRFARGTFIVHSASVLGIVGTLFYIIFNHHFEYQYAYQHSSMDLPLRYMLSCFWEGQEGSFLLWMFWNVVLGFMLIFTSKGYETRTMAVFALVQVWLASMLLGFYGFDFHYNIKLLGITIIPEFSWVWDKPIGSNPFILTREFLQAPIFADADYMRFIDDGTGLNPLLQNYWMTIHPPILFLGFASTLVPFAYVVASLWKGDYKGWVAPVLPWTLFSTIILGIGILLGGIWAYEALSFGGFWAWDPVENASLVPWITLVAGMHTLMVVRATGRSLFPTYVLLILTFVMVLYSTFLTRSGVLGDTSVHSFTDMGMFWQLVAFLVFFMVLGFGTMFARIAKGLPKSPPGDEAFFSRDFWMFLMSLLFFVSAALITHFTSIPLYNKIFGTEWAPPTNVIAHYNNQQVWVAVFAGIMTAMVQFFGFTKGSNKKVWGRIALTVFIAVLITVPAAWYLEISLTVKYKALGLTFPFISAYYLMLFSGIYAIIGNLGYMIMVVRKAVLRGKLRAIGGPVAHIGFGLMLVGIVVSQLNQEVISVNKEIDFGDALSAKDTRENILIYKDSTVNMQGYQATYVKSFEQTPETVFEVTYKKVNEEGKVKDEFTLFPNVVFNSAMEGQVANPAIKRYFSHEIYTHITSVPIKEPGSDIEIFEPYEVAIGDTFYISKAFGVVDSVIRRPKIDPAEFQLLQNDIPIGVSITFYTIERKSYRAAPSFVIRGNSTVMVEDDVQKLGAKVRIEKIDPVSEKFTIGVHEKPEEQADFIIMKAIMFPFISLLWIGIVVLALGFIMSISGRILENKRTAKSE